MKKLTIEPNYDLTTDVRKPEYMEYFIDAQGNIIQNLVQDKPDPTPRRIVIRK